MEPRFTADWPRQNPTSCYSHAIAQHYRLVAAFQVSSKDVAMIRLMGRASSAATRMSSWYSPGPMMCPLWFGAAIRSNGREVCWLVRASLGASSCRKSRRAGSVMCPASQSLAHVRRNNREIDSGYIGPLKIHGRELNNPRSNREGRIRLTSSAL